MGNLYECCWKIYSEVGGLKECDMGLRDINRYIKAMRTGYYEPEEDMDYESQKNNNDEILEVKAKESDERKLTKEQKEEKLELKNIQDEKEEDNNNSEENKVEMEEKFLDK